MRWTRLALIAVVLAAIASSAAHAQVQSKADDLFTREEEAIIARNELLVQLRQKNPRSVMRILDLLATIEGRRHTPPKGGRTAGEPTQAPTGALPFDPARNPDLLAFQRASPEAAHDLLQLLKRAGAGTR